VEVVGEEKGEKSGVVGRRSEHEKEMKKLFFY